MKIPTFATFKYDHGQPVSSTPAQKAALAACILVVIAAFFIFPPLGFVSLIAGFIFLVKTWPRKSICISPRYLICGNSVVYYRKVDKMVLRRVDGSLTLHWNRNRSLCIEREKFPTNARKTAKIAANKTAKFDKVSRKIIEKVLAVSPDAELAGIDRADL